MAEADWSTYANDAINVSICQPKTGGLTTLSTFNPEYTEQFFGQNQTIFGYKGLRVQMRFAAHDLYPNVEISYDQKFKSVGDTKATDLLSVLRKFLPEEAFGKTSDFTSRLQVDPSAASFSPPGELVESYTVGDRTFEIWCGELADPAVTLLIRRMQIFVSFLIDGGLPLTLDDQKWTMDRWRIFFVYEKSASPPAPTGSSYSICGYSTAYRFLTYQPSTLNNFKSNSSTGTLPPSPLAISSLPNRSRISQFLILPSHQNMSHGSHLYNAMIKTFLADPACIEITVEDPNESFDGLRDFCDFSRLTSNETFKQLQFKVPELNPSKPRPGARVPTSTLYDRQLFDSLRRQNKIAPRQYARLLELWFLSHIPQYNREAGPIRLTQRGRSKDEADRAYYFWRLLVKQRIYKKNRDLLIQMEHEEKVEKLEETLNGQLEEYERLLDRIQLYSKGSSHDVQSATSGGSPSGLRKKRKIVEDDEDAMSTGSKRQRTEEMA